MLILIAAVGHQSPEALSFSIKLDKSNYNKGEPVKCSLILKNNSTKDIVVNNRFLVNLPMGPHEISFQIFDRDLKQVLFTTKINAGFESNRFILLHPGTTEVKTYILSDHFDLTEKGNYSIVAYYENKNDPPAALKLPSAWKGTLMSNKVVITMH